MDPFILQCIQGVRLNFENHPPIQFFPLPELKFPPEEKRQYTETVEKLCQSQVIELCSPISEQFVSSVFFRPKKDNTFRMILNLKHLNVSIEYHKFKMDTLRSVLHLVKPFCYIASCDILSAYFTVPVHPQDRKYLRFLWNGQLYQFTCLPNGLTSAPRIFTKILKPVLSSLRLQGFTVLNKLYR